MFTAEHVTTLADIAKLPVATVWGAIVEAYNASTNPFREAGVVKTDALMTARATGEGVRTQVQSWNPLPYRESNIGSDDPTSHSVPMKLSSRTLEAVRQHRNVSFSEMDLVVDMIGQDPLANIGARFGGEYMPQDITNELFAILEGLIVADKANGNKITLTDPTNAFNINMMIAGLQKMGDAKRTIKTLGLSSASHALLQSQNVNGFVPVAETDLGFGKFGGLNLLVDDRFEDKKVGTKTLARFYGLGNDLFHEGVGTAKKPFEVERDASAGDGAGQETVYFRWQHILHPVGYSYTGTYEKVGGPSFAELSKAGAWTRIAEQKTIPLIVIEAPLSSAA